MFNNQSPFAKLIVGYDGQLLRARNITAADTTECMIEILTMMQKQLSLHMASFGSYEDYKAGKRRERKPTELKFGAPAPVIKKGPSTL